MVQQLTLNVHLNGYATLGNFSAGDNHALVEQLEKSLTQQGENFFYLWGSEGVGRTHLLHAACHFKMKQGLPCTYLPLEEYKTISPDIFNDLESLDLVCIDDIDAIAGEKYWQEALFHLYNRARDNGTLLIVTGKQPLQTLSLTLLDLKSRLSWGLVYQIHDLTDEEKCSALITRAKIQGLNLSLSVARFLLSHCSRNMVDLVKILNQLDHASLAQQRSLTIPFVKSVLKV